MLKILLAIPVKYMTYKGIFKPVGDPPTGFKSQKWTVIYYYCIGVHRNYVDEIKFI